MPPFMCVSTPSFRFYRYVVRLPTYLPSMRMGSDEWELVVVVRQAADA